MKVFLNILIVTGIVLAILWFVCWLFSHKTYEVAYGVSFNQQYATSLGLSWKDTYRAILEELHPSYIRIAAMWSEVESTQGTYNFSDIDWMMNMAAQYDTKIVLVVGQKAPRWPECYIPEWIDTYTTQEAKQEALLAYVQETVLRYKKHPALELWQVENEAFIHFTFGECANFDRDLVSKEVDLVRHVDPDRKIVMTDSGELSTWRQPSRLSDVFGTTMYRIVRNPIGMRISYAWLPAGFYRLKAALWGKTYDTFFVSELQAEPWFTSTPPIDTATKDMEKTMTPARLQQHIDFARHVGASRVYFWGVEWWYYMKQDRDDARYWDMAKDVM